MDKIAAHGSQANNTNTYEHNLPRLPPIAKASGHRSREAIEEYCEREHSRSTSAASTELVQNIREKDAKRVPDAINEGHAGYGYGNNHPAIK